MRRISAITLIFGGGLALVLLTAAEHQPLVLAAPSQTSTADRDRTPVDLALTPDERWLVTANQSSHSISLVRVADGQVVAEAPCGQRPAAIAITPDGLRVLVSGSHSADVCVFEIKDATLSMVDKIAVGADPHGIAVAPDGKLAYVALTASAEVAVLDLEKLKAIERIPVGRWPRYLSLTPDGSRLAVGCSGDGGITVIDVAARKVAYNVNFVGLNIGHLQTSSDGQYAYFPWMMYGDRPVSPGNIRQGWVMANRIARVRLDGPARREAIALDPRGKAVADPHGMALTADGQSLISTAAGSHELVVYRLGDLPLREDGPGDHIDPAIAQNQQRFYRIELGGRPLGVRASSDGRVFVANALLNAVQVVDLEKRRVVTTIELGGPREPSLARQGEAIFYDARRSADQWYSCHSCHYEGGTNIVTMDTTNDGSTGTYKTVLSLRNVTHTGPWFWHGWQKDLSVAVRKSLVDTMHGPRPTDHDVEALVAYFETLPGLPNPNREPGGALSPAAERGKAVFASDDAGCASCHSGEHFTDGKVHDVGLGSQYDAYKGFNTPSLLGTYSRTRYLHHGRAGTLEELLTDLHSPEAVSGTRALTADELQDLVAYLKSL